MTQVQTTRIGLLDDSKKFQLLIDNIKDTFQNPIWPNYLVDKFTLDLDWRAVLGVLSNSPAASVIDFSSGKPIYTRPTVSKLSGELATLGNKWQMNKREVRQFFELQDRVGTLGITPADLIGFLYPDLRDATIGPHKTIDRLFLEAISTGEMSLTATNNPKGAIWNDALDWGIAKSYVTTSWATSGSAVPLTDIKAVVDVWIAKGIKFNLMKMSTVTFNLMIATTTFLAAFGFDMSVGNKKITATKNNLIGVDNVNIFLSSVGLPTIEIIDTPINIQAKDGSTSVITPFADHRVAFSADNNYGELFRTYSNEERSPIPGRSYAKSQNVLISKYQDGDGNEFTQSEFIAIPVLDKANSISIMVTNATSA